MALGRQCNSIINIAFYIGDIGDDMGMHLLKRAELCILEYYIALYVFLSYY